MYRTPICCISGQTLMVLMNSGSHRGYGKGRSGHAKILASVVTVGQPRTCMCYRHTWQGHDKWRHTFLNFYNCEQPRIVSNSWDVHEAHAFASEALCHIQEQVANECCLSAHTQSILTRKLTNCILYPPLISSATAQQASQTSSLFPYQHLLGVA